MYQRILIPLDSSDLAEQVLPIAVSLARKLRAPLALMSVIQEIPEELQRFGDGDQEELAVGWQMQARRYLDQVASRLSRQGIEATFTISQGDTASCILDEAGKDSTTLIAMSTHGWIGSARWNLGSATLKVLQAASNPVLVVRAQMGADLKQDPHLDNIIVPLDGSAVSEEAMPHAVTLARAHFSRLNLLRVTPSGWDYYSHMDHGVLHSGDVSKVARDRAKRYLDGMSEKLAEQGYTTVEQRVGQGEPAGTIIDLAEQTPNSLVTMVTHGQGSSGPLHWSIGSVAQRVAGACQVPVLVIPAKVRGQGR